MLVLQLFKVRDKYQTVNFYSMLTCFSDVKGNGDVDKHMEMGNKMLAAGQLADALSHYHAAIGE